MTISARPWLTIVTKLIRDPDVAHCKVDDLAGHRLGEIITFREGLHRVFSVESTMRSVEVVEVLPFDELGLEIDVAFV